jgi:NADH-quinone oxidoreductase subunit G
VEIADMPDRVVWLPTNSTGCTVRSTLRAGHGAVVSISGETPPRSAE